MADISPTEVVDFLSELTQYMRIQHKILIKCNEINIAANTKFNKLLQKMSNIKKKFDDGKFQIIDTDTVVNKVVEIDQTEIIDDDSIRINMQEDEKSQKIRAVVHFDEKRKENGEPVIEVNADTVENSTNIMDTSTSSNILVSYETEPKMDSYETILMRRCDICHKPLMTDTGYDLHMRLHSKKGLHSCDQCDKAFARKHDLKRHMMIHSGEKPYTCEICGESYTWAKSLKRHREKKHRICSFNCRRCGKTFRTRGALMSHEKTHGVYQCGDCKETFVFLKDLELHNCYEDAPES